MVIKAVLFDYGGTLVHHKTQETIIKEHELIVKYLNKLGCKITREEFDVKTKKLKDDYDNWKHKTHLEIRPEKFWLHAFKVLGIKGNMKMAKEIQKIRVGGHKDILFPSAVTVLKKLKKKYKIGMIANTLFGGHNDYMKKLGIDKYFDVVILSYEVGVRKPTEKIFLIALSKLKVKPEEAVFVGNELEADVVGPKSMGMKTVLIADSQMDDLPENQKPDFVIKKIKDLLKLL